METKNWTPDASHSTIGFTVKHMMFSKVAGRFDDYQATIEMADGNFETAQLKFEAKSDSINTNNPERDGHLKSQDFFNAEINPTVNFESTNITKKSENDYTVEGNLTMNGITNPITLDAEYSGVMKDPWGNDRIALVMTGKVDRHNWDMKWNSALEAGGVLVSKDVNFDIETQFI